MRFSVSSYKKTLLIAIAMLFSMSQSIFAQTEKPKNLVLYDTQPYHFGFIIAGNSMFYSLDYKDSYQFIEHSSDEFISGDKYSFDKDDTYLVNSLMPITSYGFTVGVVGNLRLDNHFDLRLIPSLSFGTRDIEYRITSVNTGEMQRFKKDLFSTFMEFPLLVKYKSKRHNNFAAYVIGGGDFKIDLTSQKKDKTDDGNTKNIKVKRADIAAEIGAGVDFYTGYFKFGVEAKWSFGLLDIMNPQGKIYDSSMNGLHDRMFYISLTFE